MTRKCGRIFLFYFYFVKSKNSKSGLNFSQLTVLNNLRPLLTIVLFFKNRIIADLTYFYAKKMVFIKKKDF